MTEIERLDQWRQQLTSVGIWCSTDKLPASDAADLAAEIESLGYGAFWQPETTGRDPFAHLAHLATRTETLLLATGIANIHHRHPGAMRQAADTLAELSDGRFLLALGVSHAPLVEGLRGLDARAPEAAMRNYLTGLEASPYHAVRPARPAPRLVGALGPRMLELAGELADGAHPYWTTPVHTERARRALGPDKLLCVEQKTVRTTDRTEAQATAAAALEVYVTLPNYRNNWHRLGFTDGDIDAPSDRFVDAVLAWGDEVAIRERVQEHLDAGADHVCLQPLVAGHATRVDREALRALAPGASTPPPS